MYIVCLVFFGDFRGFHSVGAMFRMGFLVKTFRGFRMLGCLGAEGEFGVGRAGGGGGDSDTWTSCIAKSCLGQLFRLLVPPLSVLPMILTWCPQW